VFFLEFFEGEEQAAEVALEDVGAEFGFFRGGFDEVLAGFGGA
jgi:hypothetical protein